MAKAVQTPLPPPDMSSPRSSLVYFSFISSISDQHSSAKKNRTRRVREKIGCHPYLHLPLTSRRQHVVASSCSTCSSSARGVMVLPPWTMSYGPYHAVVVTAHDARARRCFQRMRRLGTVGVHSRGRSCGCGSPGKLNCRPLMLLLSLVAVPALHLQERWMVQEWRHAKNRRHRFKSMEQQGIGWLCLDMDYFNP